MERFQCKPMIKMKLFTDRRKKKFFIWGMTIACVLIIVVIFAAVYLNDYYRADMEAIDAYTTTNNVSKQVLDDNTIIFASEDAEAGFIFYPGGKVEYTAYEPLMEALASKGIMCVLIEMPWNLAVFDINAAEGIQEQFPDIENWYIGGHSLGGSMAASYLSENVQDFAGLILLGSYSAANLSTESLEVLSIYGSEDEVLNFEKYNDNIENLPDDFTEVVIDGGCHGYFGMYGPQEGDGTPTISNEEQIELTVTAVVEFVS